MKTNWKDNSIYKSLSPYIENPEQIKPSKEALMISIVYLIFGGLWIYITDLLVYKFISDPTLYRNYELYKGALYVFLTTLLIYSLIWKRIHMFNQAISTVIKTSANIKKSNEELSEAKEELSFQIKFTENIVNAAAVIIAVWDEEGKVKKINPYGEKILGFTSSELFNRKWIDVLVPYENRDKLNRDLQNSNGGLGLKDFHTELLTKSGERVTILWNSNLINDQAGSRVEIVSVGTNITERIALEKKLYHQAFFDSLTALPNRVMLEQEINNLINEETNPRFAVIHIDIDNFKYINDILGHQTGDLFLKYAANKLKAELGKDSFIARQVGDEFAVLLKGVADEYEVTKVIEKLIANFEGLWKFHHHEFFVSISAGISLYPKNGQDVTTIIKNANMAMYLAKKEGKGKYVFYKNDFLKANIKTVNMANRLKNALDREHLTLFYQPQVNIITGEIIGVEVLVRWIDPERGFIPPIEFIPLAEETGQIYKVERWIFKTALEQKQKWEQNGLKHIKVAINLSSKTLASDVNFRKLEYLLEAYTVDYSTIVVEITETAIITDIHSAIRRLEILAKKGINIALDDFGTGYSSLSYLRNVPLNVIKLDRSFINSIQENGRELLIIKAVLSLCKDLNYDVVAEGIETKEQLQFLQKQQCTIGQGYLFSKPIPIEILEPQLKSLASNRITKS